MPSQPNPKEYERSGISSIARRTLTTYSTVQAMSSNPGSPAASGEIRGQAARTPAALPQCRMDQELRQ
jgi:hypothetical protein